MDQSQTKTHYEVLNVEETASLSTIKKSHRALALKFHPDKCQQKAASAKDEDEDEDEDEQDKNVEEEPNYYLKVQAAWECLRNHEKRNAYDESIRRIREKDDWGIDKAKVVKLSEMGCDDCEVLIEEELEQGDHDDNNAAAVVNSNGQQQQQKLFIYQCRCGDEFEILDEDLTVDSKHTNNLFECQSCSLTIRVVIDILFNEDKET